MSINNNAPDITVQQSMSDTKTAAATDRHRGQLRYEVDLQANNKAKVAWEHNTRENANMEIGRARNITTVA